MKVTFHNGPLAGEQEIDRRPESLPSNIEMAMPAGQFRETNGQVCVVYNRTGNVEYEFYGFVRQDRSLLEIDILRSRNGTPETTYVHAAQPRIVQPKDESNHQTDKPERIVSIVEYGLEFDGNKWSYVFVDETSDAARVEDCKKRLRYQIGKQIAASHYENPNYGMYSKSPTLEHKQVTITDGQRRASVDAVMAPIILGIWHRGWETSGSCQCTKEKQVAYVGFTILEEAEAFTQLMTESGIEVLCEPKTTVVGNTAREGEPIDLLTANVRFTPALIPRVIHALWS